MSEFILTQMHIEAARNSTDDFNLFHDKNRWHWIESNPFAGPIALGFQLACFVEDQVKSFRQISSEAQAIDEHQLGFSTYELTFAGVVKPEDALSIVVRKGKLSQSEDTVRLSNRIAVKANGKTVLLGYKRESSASTVSPPANIPAFDNLDDVPDRSFINQTEFFLKRKFMIVGNAKNLLSSAFAEQSEYIDEFIDKVCFPESYPLSLISSALLERAQAVGHDLIAEPMIYTSHKLCINKNVLASMRSNDSLNILVCGPQSLAQNGQVSHYCTGVVTGANVLFQAELQLTPLSFLV